jgi:hypothetical protein
MSWQQAKKQGAFVLGEQEKGKAQAAVDVRQGPGTPRPNTKYRSAPEQFRFFGPT